MGLRLGLIFLLLLAIGLPGPAAQAQSDDSRDRARTLFQEGVARFDAGDFSAALDSFERAYEIAPHPSVRINMANCLEQLGRYSEALDNYQSYLSESPNLKPAQRAEVAKTIERLSRHFGTIDVQLSPSQARLTVDGAEPNRNSSGALIVPTGEHVVRASQAGYEELQRIVQVDGGSSQTLSLQLQPLPTPEPALPLVVEQTAPAADEPVRGYEAEPRESGISSRVWLWTAAGTAALLTVGFATTAGLTYKAQGDFDHHLAISQDSQYPLAVRSAAYDDASDSKDKAEKLALVSDVLLGGAVLAAGATVVIWLVGKRRADQSTVSSRVGPAATRHASLDAQPLLLRHAAGLAVRGQF